VSALTARGSERRLRTRFRVHLPFILKSNDKEIQGTTRNISMLGISAYTHSPLGVSQLVHCFLKLPQASQPVVAGVTVVYCEPLPEAHPDGSYETGLFFKEFQDKGESTLAGFLEQVRRNEQKAIQAGYVVFQKRLADRRKRKRLKTLEKSRRKRARLLRKKKQLKKKRAQRSAAKKR